MNFRSVVWLGLLLVLCGCGGGGGSSNPSNPPADPAGGDSGDESEGGSGGGSSGGSSLITNGGLISGGVRLSVDSGAAGISLDVAVGGTGLVAGDIQGFGSVIANGFTLNTDSAEFAVEGAAGTQSDLKQGQQVLLVGDTTTNVATQVLYRSNIKGPVTAVSVQDLALSQVTFTVLGQTVISDASTTYANVNVADIVIGNELEVSGVVEEDGVIRASFIELKSALTEYKVTGQVSGVSISELRIGDLVVDYSGATLRDFDGATVADGDVVEVKAVTSDFVAPNQLAAVEVELLPILTLGSDAVARVEGFIDEFVSTNDFAVQTVPITIDANTEFVNGDQSSLGLGVKVQVEGDGDSSGAILAEKVTIQPTAAIRAEGNIEAIDAAARTVTVLGVVFQLRDLTDLEDSSSLEVDPLNLADLGIGDEVELRGYLDSTRVVATKLEREDLEDRARLRGFVGDIDSGSATFDLQGVSISVQTGVTEFQDANDSVISQTEFFDLLSAGTVVTARWDTFTSTTAVADEVSFEDD